MTSRSNPSLLQAWMPENFADRWLLAVISSSLPGEVKVLLFLLAQVIDEYGYVSVPEAELAQILNRHRSRVADRVQRAVKHGYLIRLSKGQRWAHAEYKAAIPEGN